MNALLFFLLFLLFICALHHQRNALNLQRKEEITKTPQVRALLDDIKAISSVGETRAVRAIVTVRTPFGKSDPMPTNWMTRGNLEQGLRAGQLEAALNGSTMSAAVEESNISDLLKQADELAKGLPIATEVALLKEDLDGSNTIPAGPLVHTAVPA